MGRVLLGLMLIPALVGGTYLASPGTRSAIAAPLEATAVGRLSRMLQGSFTADTAHAGVVLRKTCRVRAPALGAHVVYVEDHYARGSGRPFSQRILALDAMGSSSARAREYTLLDAGALRGACDDGVAAPSLAASDVVERQGCDVTLTLHGDHFRGRTEGSACASVLNGAIYAKRFMDVSDDGLLVHEQGYDARGTSAWGHDTAPLRYARASR